MANPRPYVSTCVLTLLSVFAVAAPCAPPAGKQSTPHRAYSQAPFSGKVAKGYLGNDPQAVFRSLQTVAPKEKSEFETTESFQKRVQESADAPLFGTLRTTSTFAFLLPSSESNTYEDRMYPNFYAEYDADTETMTAKLQFEPLMTGPYAYHFSKDQRSIIWNEVGTGREAYIGTNAFGATRAVKKFTVSKTALAISIESPFYPGNGIRDEGSTWPLDISFKVSPNRARLLEKNLRVLIIAGLKPPYYFEEQIYKEPTFDDPNESNETDRYLSVYIQDVWLIDGATGDVLAKAVPKK